MLHLFTGNFPSLFFTFWNAFTLLFWKPLPSLVSMNLCVPIPFWVHISVEHGPFYYCLLWILSLHLLRLWLPLWQEQFCSQVYVLTVCDLASCMLDEMPSECITWIYKQYSLVWPDSYFSHNATFLLDCVYMFVFLTYLLLYNRAPQTQWLKTITVISFFFISHDFFFIFFYFSWFQGLTELSWVILSQFEAIWKRLHSHTWQFMLAPGWHLS